MFLSPHLVYAGKYLMDNTLQLSMDVTNGTTRYIAYWLMGMSMSVGNVNGVLDMVFSAPLQYRDGTSRGLLGE